MPRLTTPRQLTRAEHRRPVLPAVRELLDSVAGRELTHAEQGAAFDRACALLAELDEDRERQIALVCEALGLWRE